MSFESDKRHLKQIWENAQQNGSGIIQATFKQGLKESQLKLVPSRQTSFNKAIELGTDWMVVEPPFRTATGTYNYFAVVYDITMNIPEDWIPMARYQLGYRNSASDTASVDPLRGQLISNAWFVEVEDINQFDEFGIPIGSNSTNIKKVTYHISFDVNQIGVTPMVDFEMKLFFTLFNPEKFS